WAPRGSTPVGHARQSRERAANGAGCVGRLATPGLPPVSLCLLAGMGMVQTRVTLARARHGAEAACKQRRSRRIGAPRDAPKCYPKLAHFEPCPGMPPVASAKACACGAWGGGSSRPRGPDLAMLADRSDRRVQLCTSKPLQRV